MAFTYNFTTNLLLSQVRMLIPDVDPDNPLFSDEEIEQAINMTSSQAVYVSAQRAPTGASLNTTPAVYSPRLAAAMLLDVIAGSESRLSVVERILDVTLNHGAAEASLRSIANGLRQQENMMGHFAIAEVVYDAFSARERWHNQMLRLTY